MSVLNLFSTNLQSEEFLSPFPPEECVRRLREAVDDEQTVADLLGKKQVIGVIDSLSIKLTRRGSYLNSYRIILKATIKPCEVGTIIESKFTTPVLTRVILSIWFGCVILIGIPLSLMGLLAIISHIPVGDVNPWHILFFPIVMLVFGIGIVRTQSFWSFDDVQFLTDFVKSVLKS